MTSDKKTGVLSLSAERASLKNTELFPLNIILLPEGRQRLRIFEPQYLELVTEALREEKGFVIGFKNQSDANSVTLGIYVQIIDFGEDENHVLTIDVEGECLVSINKVLQSKKGMWLGDTQFIPHWSMISTNGKESRYSKVLQVLLSSYSGLDTLYSDKQLDRPEWVVARLIELLPLPYDVKIECLKTEDFQFVSAILDTVLTER